MRAGAVNIISLVQYLKEIGVSLNYGDFVFGRKEDPKVVVVPCRDNDWERMLTAQPNSLDWLSPQDAFPPGISPKFQDPLPVLFWGGSCLAQTDPFVERTSENSIVFYADILAAAVFMLCRYEEINNQVQDQHGRFPAVESVAYKQCFLDQPLIDRYGLILEAWMKTLIPRWQPAVRNFKLYLSHDIDQISPYREKFHGIKKITHDLIKKRDITEASRSIRLFYIQVLNPRRTAEYLSIFELAELSKRYNQVSHFHFMSSISGKFDSGYDAGSNVILDCMRKLQNEEHRIGFHPSYHTIENQELFMQEKKSLEEALGITLHGGRQHYLRFRVPDTWNMWARAGMLYESTLGYADHEGFRAGTCYIYKPFDLEKNREINLLEIPIIVMDSTLKNYRKLTPEKGLHIIMKSASRCKEVGGTFTLLWHNNLLDPAWKTWAEVYREALPLLVAEVGL